MDAFDNENKTIVQVLLSTLYFNLPKNLGRNEVLFEVC